eukprot:6715031-Pyramimonas_sp.AAC.1
MAQDPGTLSKLAAGSFETQIVTSRSFARCSLRDFWRSAAEAPAHRTSARVTSGRDPDAEE